MDEGHTGPRLFLFPDYILSHKTARNRPSVWMKRFTTRTALRSGLAGAFTFPALSPAFLFALRFRSTRAGSLVPQRLPQPAHTGLEPAGRGGRDSAPPANRAHSGSQAVMLGSPAPGSALRFAAAPQPDPACPTVAGRTRPPPAGWAESCIGYCRSTSCRWSPCNWCAPL